MMMTWTLAVSSSLVTTAAPVASLRVIEEPFEKAAQICAERLDASDIEIHVIDSPDDFEHAPRCGTPWRA